ncbi:DnaA ATPase domain-containing protein [Shewanella gaetbuli]|uniref:DnaA ATPase domain-containing protein n=1 Tax=Shewanella gaetbuli TaxID=220752 RepID=UPI003B82E7FE
MNPVRTNCPPAQQNGNPSNELMRQKIASFVSSLSPPKVLYIHGQSGVGKTHLINLTLSNLEDGKKAIKVLNANSFVPSILSAINKKSLESYRSSLKCYRLVVIESIDFFSFKQPAHVELLKAVEYVLSHDHMKVIVTSQSHPSKLVGLNRKRINWLNSCIILQIACPTNYDKLLLIQAFVRKHRMQISAKAVEYLCVHGPENYFYLLGILNTLNLYYEHTNCPITIRTPEFLILLWRC